jgi:sulfatase modifying factor 1
VTNISWFAAKEYCDCQGKRLATLDEWEYVAMADEKRKDARSREEFNKYILSWYEKNKTYNNSVGKTFKNYWGVYDMHGLVWEMDISISIASFYQENPEKTKIPIKICSAEAAQ